MAGGTPNLNVLRGFAYFSSFRDQIPAAGSPLLQFPSLRAETRCGSCVRQDFGGDLLHKKTKINLLIFSPADSVSCWLDHFVLPLYLSPSWRCSQIIFLIPPVPLPCILLSLQHSFWSWGPPHHLRPQFSSVLAKSHCLTWSPSS